MRTCAVAIVLPFLLVCNATALATEINDLVGAWELSTEAKEVVPTNCRSLQYTFGPNAITLNSGQMVLNTRPEIESTGSVLVLRQVVTSYNGLPNCNGYVLPYVTGERAANLHLEARSGRLRLALRNERYVEFVRISK